MKTPLRTNLSRLGWTVWALIPVGLLAFHFGPGQAAYREDKAAKLVARADGFQREALALQQVAYDAHLAAIDARIAAFGKDDAALRQAALDANAREEEAYALAGAAWRQTADALAEAQTCVDEIGGRVREEIRLAKARAHVRTGDVAVVDDSGYLFIVDRAKDLIIVSGFNVYPAEVEEVVGQHPAVEACAVVGVPHPYTGEAVKAYVVVRDGFSVEEDDVIAFCAERLARYKCPNKVWFVEELPRGLGGKILRRILR